MYQTGNLTLLDLSLGRAKGFGLSAREYGQYINGISSQRLQGKNYFRGEKLIEAYWRTLVVITHEGYVDTEEGGDVEQLVDL
jgi:hypothetical protein